MGISIPSGQRAVQRSIAPRISLSRLFKELSCLRHLCRLAKLSAEFDRMSGLRASCDVLERKYYALQKNAVMALTV